MKLKNRVAIVTGAARGIGLASARRFAAEGARVMLLDIQKDRLDQSTENLRTEGLNVDCLTCDVSNSQDISSAFEKTVSRFGLPDVLVNNAAVHRLIDFFEMTEEQFTEIVRVNMNSTFLFSQIFARGLKSAGRSGAIVNLSSVNSRMSSPRAVAYSASKGGISALTASMSLALAPFNIRANAIAPGTIESELTTGIANKPELLEETRRRIPLGRLGHPEEIGALALFLASDDASYLTGQTIFADGGRNALSIMMPRPQVD